MGRGHLDLLLLHYLIKTLSALRRLRLEGDGFPWSFQVLPLTPSKATAASPPPSMVLCKWELPSSSPAATEQG